MADVTGRRAANPGPMHKLFHGAIFDAQLPELSLAASRLGQATSARPVEARSVLQLGANCRRQLEHRVRHVVPRDTRDREH